MRVYTDLHTLLGDEITKSTHSNETEMIIAVNMNDRNDRFERQPSYYQNNHNSYGSGYLSRSRAYDSRNDNNNGTNSNGRKESPENNHPFNNKRYSDPPSRRARGYINRGRWPSRGMRRGQDVYYNQHPDDLRKKISRPDSPFPFTRLREKKSSKEPRESESPPLVRSQSNSPDKQEDQSFIIAVNQNDNPIKNVVQSKIIIPRKKPEIDSNIENQDSICKISFPNISNENILNVKKSLAKILPIGGGTTQFDEHGSNAKIMDTKQNIKTPSPPPTSKEEVDDLLSSINIRKRKTHQNIEQIPGIEPIQSQITPVIESTTNTTPQVTLDSLITQETPKNQKKSRKRPRPINNSNNTLEVPTTEPPKKRVRRLPAKKTNEESILPLNMEKEVILDASNEIQKSEQQRASPEKGIEPPVIMPPPPARRKRTSRRSAVLKVGEGNTEPITNNENSTGQVDSAEVPKQRKKRRRIIDATQVGIISTTPNSITTPKSIPPRPPRHIPKPVTITLHRNHEESEGDEEIIVEEVFQRPPNEWQPPEDDN